MRSLRPILAVLVMAATAVTAASADTSTSSGDWDSWNKGLDGSRYAASEWRINPRTASRLRLRWAFQLPRVPDTMGKSQPAVVGGTLYVGSTDGTFHALDAKTGAPLWTFDTAAVAAGGVHGSAIWDGPAVVGDRVYFGGQSGYLYALDRRTGALVWATRVADHPLANLTSSPVYYRGRLYLGVSGYESGTDQSYACCTLRGQVVAVDAATGQVSWRYYTVPEPRADGTWPSGATRYAPSGGAVWGTPSIDTRTGVLYVGTGQNYTGNGGDFDSMLALDARTGAVVWKRRMTDVDTWRLLCRNPSATGYCPSIAESTALDFDLGAVPNLFTVHGRELVGIGQKTGVYHVFDARTGEIVWQRELGLPIANGGDGGIQWGASYDGDKLYVATYMAKPGTLFALDPATGDIVWQTPNPANGCAWGGAAEYPQMCQLAHTPAVTTSPGLVYLGSMDGKFRVYSSRTGRVLWEYDTVRDFDAVNGPGRGSAISGNGGAVVADGMVYVQSGYYPFYPSPSDKGYVLLAFGL
ncbi:PQQ-binding-like beta-propeller repeat protein [Actinophytocola sp.]|uniref:outer membrane protein assembly factor BamB family protein n=1 Tax=Actinophytocola sp. TaxID=1872138 RepID=UPI0038998FA5